MILTLPKLNKNKMSPVALAFIILLCAFEIPNLQGQSNIDSLLTLVETSYGHAMIKNLSTDAHQNRVENLDDAIKFSKEAISLSKEQMFIPGLIFNYRLLGNLYYRVQRYEDAIICYDKCIGYAIPQSDSVTIRECYLNKGAMLFTQGLTKHALNNYLLALEYSANLDKEVEYNNIGTVFFFEKEYEEAFNYYDKSLRLMEAKGNRYGVAAASNNIGDVYYTTGKYDVALIYYRRAYAISHDIADKEGMVYYLNNIGNVKTKTGNLDSAVVYFRKSLAIAEELNNDLLKTRTLHFIGQTYYHTSNYKAAKQYLRKAFEIAENIGTYREILDAALLLRDIYEHDQDYKNAYKFANIYKYASDSIRNNEAKKQVMTIIFDYKLKLNELEALKLVEIEKSERRKNKYQLLSIIFVLVIVLLLVVLFLAKVRQRLKMNRVEKEKAVLRRENLERELEFRNKEIVEKALSIIEKNELINSTVKRLNVFSEKLAQKHKSEMFNIQKDLISKVLKNHWEEFHHYFTKIYSGFFTSLEKDYPGLTLSEKRLCAFLKLDMSTKDIATLTYQNYKSVEVARTRLRKRLDLTNYNISFQEFFSRYN